MKILLPNKSYYSKLLLILFGLQFFTTTNTLRAQTADEYVLKSLFLTKLTNFVEWPENSKINKAKEPVKIFIYGNSPIKKELQNIVKTKELKIKKKKVVIKTIKYLSDIKNADILFISSSEKYSISKIVKTAANYPILTIGDTKGYTEKGVMLNMTIANRQLVFDVNLKSAKNSSMYMSSKLLVNAKKVIK